MCWYSKPTLEMPTYRNESTSMYQLWYKVYHSSACHVKNPPLTTKSKEKQNHHEETWFKKIVYSGVKYEENMTAIYCPRKPALCQVQRAPDSGVFAFWTSRVRRTGDRIGRLPVSLWEVWEMCRENSRFFYISLSQWNFPNLKKFIPWNTWMNISVKQVWRLCHLGNSFARVRDVGSGKTGLQEEHGVQEKRTLSSPRGRSGG